MLGRRNHWDEYDRCVEWQAKVSEAALPFESRWTEAALRRIDPVMHERFLAQRELFNAMLEKGTLDEVGEHGAALVRAYVAVVATMEAAGGPDEDARFKKIVDIKRACPGAEMKELARQPGALLGATLRRCWVLACCGAMSGKEGKRGKRGKRGKFTASLVEKKFVRRTASILSTAGRRVAKTFPTLPLSPFAWSGGQLLKAARDRCDPHQPRIVVYCSRFRRRGGCRFQLPAAPIGRG